MASRADGLSYGNSFLGIKGQIGALYESAENTLDIRMPTSLGEPCGENKGFAIVVACLAIIQHDDQETGNNGKVAFTRHESMR